MNRASQGVAGGWTIRRMDERIGWTLGFAAILAFYLATTPENRTEAYDGYDYAHAAEALPGLYSTRHLLFHVVMRLLYRACHAIHDGVTAHAVMLTVSALSASLCLVLFARLLNRHFGLSLPTSLLGAGFLGATYGFWRYSVEAEVYAPSLFLITAVLSLVFAAEDRADGAGRWIVIVPASVLAGLTVLFYQLNAIPLFLALPVLFVRRGGLPRLIAYVAAGGGVILLGYLIAFRVYEGGALTIGAFYTFVLEGGVPGPNEGVLSTVAKAVVALGESVVSGNWAFGIQGIAGSVNEVVPLHSYARDAFAASKAGVVFVYLPLLTLTALVAVGVYTTLVAVQARRPPLDRYLVFALTWFGLYSLVIALLSPGNNEVWMMAHPPLVILFAAFVIEPCVRAGRRAAPTVLLAVLLLHNAIGGIGIVYGAGGDYYREKGAWLLDNATDDDLVLLSIDGGFRNFLCYVGRLHAVTITNGKGCLERGNVLQLIETTRQRGGRIFAFDEFFEPPAALRVHAPEGYPEALALAERFRGTEQPVYRSDAGTTYRLP